ncbi:prepilin-type N-terminal cleavage/methylation domain-containing protein [Rariglobus hedericola]|nr:prepilin-type N-terminal cleavage/methylation domain-containing protein [Rariglobus hedericola]
MQRSNYRGFTLIELLVVIGLISLLAAGIGISMRNGNPTSALRAGQGSLVSLLSGARGQAALNQSDAMIVVDVTNAGNDDFLRSLQVVVRAGSGLDEWRAVGDPIMLPQGIYVVPPSSPAVLTLTGWSANRQSKGFQPLATSLAERSYDAVNYQYYPTGAFASKTYLKFQVFSSLGKTTGEGTILVTSGRRTDATTITLDNPDFIRGVFVSRYGVPTLINEAQTFDLVTVTP